MTSKKYDFTGKVALLTGSSGGIGGAVALQFAQCGAQVVITGHLQGDVDAMVSKITQITGQAPLALVGDITQDSFAEKLVNETIAKYGRLDVLFNNAGRLCADGSFNDPQLMEKYDQLMALNVRSLVKMIQLCAPHLEVTKGNIVNTASIAGFLPVVNSVYSLTKATVNQITKCAAVDFGPRGIRVNSINPGPIRTPIGFSMNAPEVFEDPTKNPLIPHTILKRFGEAPEVANMVLFLASDEASYITGSHHLVDGGYMCI